MPNLRLMRLTETLKKINTSIVSMGDMPKDIFIFLAVLLIGAGAFMIGRISVGETERKNELKIVSPSNLSATVEESQFGTNPSTTESQIDQLGSSTLRAFKSRHQSTSTFAKSGIYVGSRNGKVYYLPTCSASNRIKMENKVWFKDKKEAEARGYKPASNCRGI